MPAGVHVALALSAHSDNVHRGELSFWLAEPHWGKGTMQQALAQYLSYFKRAYPRVTRLDAMVITENGNARGVLLRVGMQHEATHKRYWRKEQQDWTVERYVWLKDLAQGCSMQRVIGCGGLGWQWSRVNQYSLRRSLLKLEFTAEAIDTALDAMADKVALDRPAPQQGIAVMTELFTALNAPLTLEPADTLLAAPVRLLFVYGTLCPNISEHGDAWGATYNCDYQRARVTGYQ